MARPKSFDTESVLRSAMLCFWRKGYNACSLKDLEAATDLPPSSLYNTFQSKDGLFLAALNHYIDTVVCERVERHLRTGDPLQGIENYFRECFQHQSSVQSLGCLLINSAAELGPHHDVVREKVAGGMRVAEQGLLAALARAQSQGLVEPHVDLHLRAHQLGLMLSGMLVASKVADNAAWMAHSMAAVEALLHSGRSPGLKNGGKK